MYVCTCMSGYAFRHALGYRAESWHGGRGWAHGVCGHIFEATPSGVKGHPWVNLPLKCPMATKFGAKNPWPECSALLGSKVMQGSTGVNQGSNCLEMPYGHQIGGKNPWSKLIQGSICLRNSLWLPNLVGRTPDQNVMHCWGQRSFLGSSGPTRGQLLRNALRLPNLVGRIPDQSVVHCWSQRSWRGQLGSSRGRFA